MLLDDEIIKSYYKKVNKLNKQQRITKEQVLLLTSTNIAMELLERHTLNDPERFTDETPEGILREIEEVQNKRIDNANKNLEKLAHRIAVGLYWILWFLITLIFALKFIDYSDCGAIVNWILGVLQIITGLWGALSWGGFIWSKVNIIAFIEKIIYRYLSKRLFAEK